MSQEINYGDNQFSTKIFPAEILSTVPSASNIPDLIRLLMVLDIDELRNYGNVVSASIGRFTELHELGYEMFENELAELYILDILTRSTLMVRLNTERSTAAFSTLPVWAGRDYQPLKK